MRTRGRVSGPCGLAGIDVGIAREWAATVQYTESSCTSLPRWCRLIDPRLCDEGDDDARGRFHSRPLQAAGKEGGRGREEKVELSIHKAPDDGGY